MAKGLVAQRPVAEGPVAQVLCDLKACDSRAGGPNACDPSSLSDPPYGQIFVILFWCVFTLYYDYMCSDTDFTQEIFSIQLLESPSPPTKA